jgi:hypothetical protein
VCAVLGQAALFAAACGGRTVDASGAEGGLGADGRLDAGSAGGGSVVPRPPSTEDAGTATDSGIELDATSSGQGDSGSGSACWPASLGPGCEGSNSMGGLGCVVDIHPYVASSPDHLEMLNLEYDSYADAGVNRTLTYVATSDRCGDVDHGWYFDDPVSPTKAIACPAPCSCLEANGSMLMMTMSCPRLSAPGAEPPAGAPAVCATARPPVCNAMIGGISYTLVKCSGLGEEFWIVPLTEVNVVLSGPGGANSGYASYVPSADDCASVVEGWFFEPNTNPPKVALCPTTCSCVKSQSGMVVQIVYGCPRWSALAP